MKNLFLGHLQPGVSKYSKDLAILILKFDDVTVKTIYKEPFHQGCPVALQDPSSKAGNIRK